MPKRKSKTETKKKTTGIRILGMSPGDITSYNRLLKEMKNSKLKGLVRQAVNAGIPYLTTRQYLDQYGRFTDMKVKRQLLSELRARIKKKKGK